MDTGGPDQYQATQSVRMQRRAEGPSGPDRRVRRRVIKRKDPARMLVLLVDDESFMRQIYQILLHRVFKARVMTAMNGDDALRRAAAVRPSLVISDVNHPGLDGLELARELRRLYSRLPVLLISGAMSGAIQAKAMEAGATGCLSKPFTTDEFLRLVRRVLQRK